jgi:hypothetical protein
MVSIFLRERASGWATGLLYSTPRGRIPARSRLEPTTRCLTRPQWEGMVGAWRGHVEAAAGGRVPDGGISAAHLRREVEERGRGPVVENTCWDWLAASPIHRPPPSPPHPSEFDPSKEVSRIAWMKRTAPSPTSAAALYISNHYGSLYPGKEQPRTHVAYHALPLRSLWCSQAPDAAILNEMQRPSCKQLIYATYALT